MSVINQDILKETERKYYQKFVLNDLKGMPKTAVSKAVLEKMWVYHIETLVDAANYIQLSYQAFIKAMSQARSPKTNNKLADFLGIECIDLVRLYHDDEANAKAQQWFDELAK